MLSKILSSTSNKIMGIIIMIILIASTVALIVYNQRAPNSYGIDIESIHVENMNYNHFLEVDLTILKTNFYKGETIPFNLSLDIRNTPAYLREIEFSVRDNENDRTAKQLLSLDVLLNPSMYVLQYEIKQGFDLNGFVPLINKTYTLLNYTINYIQRHTDHSISNELNIQLIGSIAPEFNQMTNKIWEIHTLDDIQFDNETKTIFPNQSTGFITLTSQIETTAYPRINYNFTGLIISEVEISILSTNGFLESQYRVVNSNETGSIFIGNLNGSHTLQLNFSIFNTEVVSVNIDIITRFTPIYSIIANNNFEGENNENEYFHAIEYYLAQASERFENTLNVSFIPVAKVNFESNTESSYDELVDDAKSKIGSSLHLHNNTWTHDRGTQEENMGADVLLIFTNKIMDYLGIVIYAPDSSNAGNIAAHAQGTLNGAELPLPPRFADNLIQHELSHIFDAPDRFRPEEPSIMTKSTVDTAVADIYNGQFWLFLTTWLEEDIQTMYDALYLYR